ncbi:YqaA family protein [Pseudothioclava nitratireducens]|jgi:membrane protein YqaA with SNARE-associated domain|uniref:YqaA family protein n=1 Tax=Pseudothioclava nitratireducens TaxID=1928646 RepID=UPI0023DB2C09|nr:YqaA family protein [Defluviimonas nitratireducens]MDF1619781.1 DedA family protein [Defluviimonas nitratireducens]
MFENLSLFGLFISAMLAASPVPLQSEVVFVALQTAGEVALWQMVLVAGIGNTLGALITYWLGRGVNHWRDRKWFPASPAQLERGHRWFERWGKWVLLLSWAPGGDLACLVAGVLRLSLWEFVPLVFLAKTGRYAVLGWVTQQALALTA